MYNYLSLQHYWHSFLWKNSRFEWWNSTTDFSWTTLHTIMKNWGDLFSCILTRGYQSTHSVPPVYSLCPTSSWMDSFTILLRQLDERPNLILWRVITSVAVLHSEEPDEQQKSPQKILDFPKKLKCYKEMIRKYWPFEKEVIRTIFKQLFTSIIQAKKKKRFYPTFWALILKI